MSCPPIGIPWSPQEEWRCPRCESVYFLPPIEDPMYPWPRGMAEDGSPVCEFCLTEERFVDGLGEWLREEDVT